MAFKLLPGMATLGHCKHCFNSMGTWACREASHDTACKQCGAVKAPYPSSVGKSRRDAQ